MHAFIHSFLERKKGMKQTCYFDKMHPSFSTIERIINLLFVPFTAKLVLGMEAFKRKSNATIIDV